jgi:predicted kinase
MSELNECLKILGVPQEIKYEQLSYSEKQMYKICVAVTRGYEVIVDASVFDRDTLRKLINYLNEKGIEYEVINK